MTLSGNPLDFVLAFLYGVLASFMPCIYALIPVSASYIGAGTAGSRLKGLFLSLTYVSGIALTYSALGLIASLTGSVFGRISSLPQVNLAVGVIIIVFGIAMLDIFYLPTLGLKKLPGLKNKGHLSVFFLGLSSGLLISPCLTPVLGAILAYLAAKRNLLYGTLLLFCFAYGMGFVLILAGTSTYLLLNLPKAGKWMVYIKKVCAFIVIGMGVYFVLTAIRRMI